MHGEEGMQRDTAKSPGSPVIYIGKRKVRCPAPGPPSLPPRQLVLGLLYQALPVFFEFLSVCPPCVLPQVFRRLQSLRRALLRHPGVFPQVLLLALTVASPGPLRGRHVRFRHEDLLLSTSAKFSRRLLPNSPTRCQHRQTVCLLGTARRLEERCVIANQDDTPAVGEDRGLDPAHRVAITRPVQERVEPGEGEWFGHGQACRYLLQVRVVADERREIPGEPSLVHPHEAPVLARPTHLGAPALYGGQADGVDAVREEHQMDKVVGIGDFQVTLEPVRRRLRVKHHPEWYRSRAQRPPGFHEDERFDEEPVRRQPVLFVPQTVEIGHQRARVLGLLEEDASYTVTFLAREPLDILAKDGLETPLRLWSLAVGLRGVPVLPVRSVPREVVFYPLAAAQVLLGRRAAQSAELEDVTLADPGRGPLQGALRDEKRGPLRQGSFQESLIRVPKLQAFDPEVGHAPRHQPVLVGIEHVVQLQLGVRREQHPRQLPAPLQLLNWLVRVHAAAPYGDEEGLRQPGDAQSGAKVDKRAVRGADHRGRVVAARVVAHHPPGYILGANLVQLPRRYGLAAAAPRVYLLAHPPGHDIYDRYKRFHERLNASRHRPYHRKVLAAQVIAEGTQHRRLGVEVRDVPGRLHALDSLPF